LALFPSFEFRKSNSASAQNVTLQIKVGGRKMKTCQFGSAKWFRPSIFVQFAEPVERHSKAQYLPEKSVLNMIRLLPPISDWPILMVKVVCY
jgi:hypothetical protein